MAIKDLISSERREGAIAESYMLADTGRYYDNTDIEYVLRFGYGLSDARALLDYRPTRRVINRRCADAGAKLTSGCR